MGTCGAGESEPNSLIPVSCSAAGGRLSSHSSSPTSAQIETVTTGLDHRPVITTHDYPSDKHAYYMASSRTRREAAVQHMTNVGHIGPSTTINSTAKYLHVVVLRQISCSSFWSMVTLGDTSDNAFYSSRQWCIVLLTMIFSSGRPAEGPRVSGRGPEANRRPPCGRAKASLQSTCVLPLPSVRPP